MSDSSTREPYIIFLPNGKRICREEICMSDFNTRILKLPNDEGNCREEICMSDSSTRDPCNIYPTAKEIIVRKSACQTTETSCLHQMCNVVIHKAPIGCDGYVTMVTGDVCAMYLQFNLRDSPRLVTLT